MAERDDEQLIELHRLAEAGQIATGMAHEARNALTGVLGFAQLARKRIAAGAVDEVGEMVGLIEEEARRCLAILTELLDYGRPRAQVIGPVDVAELVRSVERLASGRLRLAGSTLRTQVAPSLPPVRGEPSLLAQVLLNLALNAMEAMPDGGTVRIEARAADGAVEVAVTDEGPGVDPSVRDRLFSPFATTKGGGTGLGLFVSRAIVDRLGGALVHEAGERGATFVVRLPSWSAP